MPAEARAAAVSASRRAPSTDRATRHCSGLWAGCVRRPERTRKDRARTKIRTRTGLGGTRAGADAGIAMDAARAASATDAREAPGTVEREACHTSARRWVGSHSSVYFPQVCFLRV